MKNCVILAKFYYEIRILLLCCKLNCLEQFGDNLARYGNLVAFLAKNECSRNFKSRACNINRKRDLSECSRTIGKIVDFTHQAPP